MIIEVYQAMEGIETGKILKFNNSHRNQDFDSHYQQPKDVVLWSI